ncbi:MAG: DUF2207 domain-containing protein, partial [Candidatus Diapherotrites archaeon]|nr:DUF2207 domain-containing protein [Candidatus Diapherotrites archaeon]
MKFNKYFVLLFVLLFAFSVSAKSFSFSNVQTDYQIMDNGLVKVKESMKLNFSGDFHFGYRDIKLDNGNGQKIQNILVKVGGVVTPYKLQELGYEKIGSKELVEKRIYYEFSATNEAKEIVLEYELVNAVTVYNDGLEFFWKIWPEQWQEGVPELNGAIALPGKVADPKEVYSWGHPTVNGKLGLQDNQKLIFQVFNLPAQQFLEIRTFFPNTLKSTEFTLVKNENGLEKITEEENNQFYVGNILKFLLDIIPILILLLVPIIFITLWWVDGREPKIEYDAMYEREIPFNYSPAIVSALINQDSKKPNNES